MYYIVDFRRPPAYDEAIAIREAIAGGQQSYRHNRVSTMTYFRFVDP
jgi:hypothetical protein